jgi:biopolymer transport protein ExbD
MTPTRLRRRRERQGGGGGGGHMNLVPFIDVMVILVVFLLLHTAEVEILPAAENIRIPQSVSEQKPRETVVVMITRDELLVNGKPVATVAEVRAAEALVIGPLKLALEQQAAARVLAANSGSEADVAAREVTIMGDRSIPYAVLRKVMATCTDASYGKVSLAVVEKESAAGSTA